MRTGLFRYEPFTEPDEDGHRHFFYLVRKDPAVSEAVRAWCESEFGPLPEIKDLRSGRWWEAHGTFVWIRAEQDAFQFRLRWC